MARNGSGTYNLPAGNPVVTGTAISSTWANNTLGDMATALTGSIASDGQTTPTANLPMGNFAHTGVANATNRTMYAAAGQVQDNVFQYLTSVSGADTITAVASYGMTGYVTGQRFTFISAGTNTGAVTLNINGIGAKAVTKNGTTALTAGDIASGMAVTVTYDGTRFQIANIAPSATVTSVSGGSTGLYFASTTAVTCTITTASPAVFSVSLSSDVPANGTRITLKTTGTLPTGLSPDTIYYVINASTTTFSVSLTNGGAGVNTTASGSGTHSFELLSTTGSVEMAGITGIVNGGTGLASITPNGVMVGNGSGALQTVRPSTNNYVLTSTKGSTITAGSFVIGVEYTIVSTGSTNFQAIGAANNNVGTVFTATGVGSGTGTASINTWTSAPNSIQSATSQATTSGTNIDFTGIPSWVKKITVIFQGVSKSATANLLIQLGTSSGFVTTGYFSTGTEVTGSPNMSSSTAGFVIKSPNASDFFSGQMIITLISGNFWVESYVGKLSTSTTALGGGDINLPGILDRIRLTTTGTDTFDAGSINILYE